MGRRQPQLGLTLVELLAALALSALLSVAVLTVLTSLSRGQRLQERSGAPAVETFHRLLASDLVHARQWRVREDGQGLYLDSLSVLDRRTMERTHLPAVIAYEVRAIDERNWLVRTQQQAGHAAWTELVWPDVRAVRAEALEEPQADDGADAWREPVSGLLVTLEPADPTLPAMKLVCRVR